MHETIIFHFAVGDQPVHVNELSSLDLDRGGIVLSGETSAWPRALRFGFEGVGGFKNGLDALRRNTADGSHRFGLTVNAGSLAIRTIAPEHIPTGTYDFSLRIADVDLNGGIDRVEIREGNGPVDVRLDLRPHRHQVTIADTIHTDPLFDALVIGNSRLDGQPIVDWLRHSAPRPKRKACLLNLLARLRAIHPAAPLLGFVREIFHADVDRLYATVDAGISAVLSDPQAGFALDDGPLHATHRKLLRRIPKQDQDVTEEYQLRSFRHDAQPSLQVVLAIPPNDKPGRGTYADIDIDLGNPKRDLAGFFVHLGELMAEGQTDHLKLFKKLRKDAAVAGHLHYTTTNAG